MSFVNGRIYKCDRCGKEVFRKCTGEGETDGGFTRWNEFDPLPVGWNTHRETGLLCRDCNNQYESMLKKFMEK